MALKRMFSMRIVDKNEFLNMPATARCLYFEMGMRADDYGFISAPLRTVRYLGFTEIELQILIDKGFIIPFSGGVCVITDWKTNNTIASNRIIETTHQKEYAQLMTIGNKDNKHYVKMDKQLTISQFSSVKHAVIQDACTDTDTDIDIDIEQQHKDNYSYIERDKNTSKKPFCQDGLPTDLQELSTILIKHGVKGEEIVKSFFADRDETYYQIKAFSEKTETEWRSIKNPTAYFINAVKNKYRPPVANSEKNKKQPDPNCEYCGGTGYRQSEPFMGETHKCVCKCCQ